MITEAKALEPMEDMRRIGGMVFPVGVPASEIQSPDREALRISTEKQRNDLIDLDLLAVLKPQRFCFG